MSEKPIEEMSLEELEEKVKQGRERIKAYASLPYRPWKYAGEEFKPTGNVFRDFYTEHEESQEPEEVIIERYIRKLKARGGYSQETALKTLLRHLAIKKEKEVG
jgi:hypothetical protein